MRIKKENKINKEYMSLLFLWYLSLISLNMSKNMKKKKMSKPIGRGGRERGSLDRIWS